ncbi:MAG TPA: DUF1549 and DUF1553 domain-containing protein [Bryobacteraceae bacterium]|nr:DUF1549 and DUF1553 domain-containing protein [Bryobacteraceae bacterium]
MRNLVWGAALVLATSLRGETNAEFFETRVRPLLVAKCHSCHSGKVPMAGVDLASAAGAKAVLSKLGAAVRYEGQKKMPPTGKLRDPEIAILTRWVELGAPWGASPTASRNDAHWSFQPIRAVAPPAVKNSAWVRNEIDRFVLAKLEANGITPAPPADDLTLLRRISFGLTGLPPTENEVAEVAVSGPAAGLGMVDRLLASPRYGEHWARHWMDVARYADSTGADEDHRYPHAWRYRDYLIDAFNRDLPFDQFVREQVAGDLLPSPDGGVNVRGTVATGFLALGPKLIAEQDKPKMFYDIVDEQIEVAGKAFLGLTIACARCHDHKFDPISTKDYYSLASIFASTKQLAKLEGTVSQLYYAPLVDGPSAAAWQANKKKLEEKQKEIDGIVGAEQTRYRGKFIPFMAKYMAAAREVYEDGKTPASAAAGLDLWVVEQWVKYLKPSGERRSHLEEWEHSPGAERGAVAARYQQRYEATEKLRATARENWKRESQEAKKRGEKEPPEPRFLPGEDRFFTEVNAAAGPFKMPEEKREALYSEESRTKLTALRAELDTLKKNSPPEPPLACAVAEGDPVEQHVFVRGDPAVKGALVAKRFPVVIAGTHTAAISSGSGRREMAAWLTDRTNPLVARVMVNRIWQWHFGEGLVRTPNNFGKLGDPPSHPELLDWLARRFIDSGWSVKGMHRLILESNTYRMSGAAAPNAVEKDTENRLLSRFSPRRLAVEELRDSLLAIDGSLDGTMGGKMMEGEGTDNEFADARKSINPDTSKRRLVYLPLRRSNLPSMLNLFDFGDATTSSDGRTQTNVAPQALFMMNSGFVAERAKSVSTELLGLRALDDSERVRRAYLRILNRPPAEPYVKDALAYVRGFPGGRTEAAWASLIRTMIASNDFLYVH